MNINMNMDKWITLNNQTAGRDKLARLIQYSCRTIWDALECINVSPAWQDKFKTIEYIMSTFRKLLRFGKCFDVFYATLRTIHYPDIAIRLTLTLSKISQSLFLLADHFMWLARTGLFQNIDPKKWAKIANKYWLFSIIMNLCRDMYEIIHLIDLHRASVKGDISRCRLRMNSPHDINKLVVHSYAVVLSHKEVAIDFIKNACDVFIPLTALGYTRLTPKTIGILGAASSIAGLIALIEPTAKLLPA